ARGQADGIGEVQAERLDRETGPGPSREPQRARAPAGLQRRQAKAVRALGVEAEEQGARQWIHCQGTRAVEWWRAARTPRAGRLQVELDALGQRQVVRVVDGIGLAAHVGAPGIRAGLAPAAGVLLAAEGAADLRARGAD